MGEVNDVESTVVIKPKIITGIYDHQKLITDKAFSWFRKPYHSYRPDFVNTAFLKAMKSQLSYLVFAATWSKESHDLLPSFFKVMSRAEIKAEKISLYFVDRNKNSGEGLEEKYRITKVPTIMVFCKERPLMKIEERANVSIETDIAERMRQLRNMIIF